MKINKFINTKIIVLILLVLCCVVIIFFALIYKNKHSETSPQKPSGYINYSPPTQIEKSNGNNIKSEVIDNEQKRNNNTPSTSIDVKPVITYSGIYNNFFEAGGYIPNIFEENGKCTLSLSKDSITKTVSVDSIKNSSSTDCPVMKIDKNELSLGKWQISISYQSEKYSGISDKKEISVE